MSLEFRSLRSAYRESVRRLGANHPFTQTWRTSVRASLRSERFRSWVLTSF
jgi:hypothetical protein